MRFFYTLLFCSLPIAGFASDLIEINPLTSKIVLVHFDDGYVRHHKRGEKRDNEYAVVSLLDVSKAMAKTSYTIQSVDDANYYAAVNPTDIGRKAKPTEFALLCQSYDNGCINSTPDHALEHWVYLFLPNAMVSGKTYTIVLDNLAANSNAITFTYTEKALHSEAIHVNNIGYSTTAPAKYAYLYHWMGDKGGLDLAGFADKEFKVYNTTTDAFVYTGTIKFRKGKTNAETGQATDTPNANFASADIYECDFSAFSTPGEYKVVVEGIGSSFPFVIDADAYREAFYWTMKGLYQNRSGIALTAPYAQFERPAPHNPQVTPGFSDRLKYSTFRTFDLSSGDGGEADKAKVESGYKGVLTNTYGWYQDAGDWDGYYTHSHIPAYLLFLYDAGPSKFSDGELDIPESGNGIPDLVDEASWLLRYFKRAKDEIKQKGWGTGGVPGARVFGDLWGPDNPNDIGQGSWQDTNRDWYVLGEDVWMSYKYAGLAAHLAAVLESIGKADPQGTNWKQEAIDAYAWAKSNTKAADESEKQGYKLEDMRFYAAASLYRLTGERAYHQVASQAINKIASPMDQGKQDQMFGVWMYLLASDFPRDPNTLQTIKSLVTATAEKYVSTADNRAARWGGDYFFPMLVGQATTPMIQSAVFGYLVGKSNAATGARFNKAIHTTADYFLGCNPLNMTWISGVGERHPVGLFHMDWWYYDKADPNNASPVLKGVVPYGPWRYEDLGPLGWWNPNWAYSDKSGNPRVYPAGAQNWPGHERWFDMRVSPLSSEFTVHQNTVVSAFIYGFLAEGSTTDLVDGELLVTGLEPADEESMELAVYPNPANETIIISVKDKLLMQKVMLRDLNGHVIRVNEFSKGKKKEEMTVRSCNTGVYILEITLTDGSTLARKVQVCR